MTIKELIKELNRWSDLVGENSLVRLSPERDVKCNYYDVTGIAIIDQGEVEICADWEYTYDFEDYYKDED